MAAAQGNRSGTWPTTSLIVLKNVSQQGPSVSLSARTADVLTVSIGHPQLWLWPSVSSPHTHTQAHTHMHATHTDTHTHTHTHLHTHTHTHNARGAAQLNILKYWHMYTCTTFQQQQKWLIHIKVHFYCQMISWLNQGWKEKWDNSFYGLWKDGINTIGRFVVNPRSSSSTLTVYDHALPFRLICVDWNRVNAIDTSSL